MPHGRSIALAILYSVGAHGIMTLNDVKAIEGDRQMGVGSPGAPGRRRRTACAVMALPQVVVIALLPQLATLHATAIAGLPCWRAVLMAWFMKKPVERALFHAGSGCPCSCPA